MSRVAKQRRKVQALLVVLLGVFVLLNLRQRPASYPVVEPVVDIQIEPERVLFYPRTKAGSPLPAGMPLRLVLSTPAGPLVWSGESDGGLIPINLPYVRAGKTPYRFSAGDAVVTGSFEKEPGPPVGVLKLRVGRRMARVTADAAPALIVHPLDAQENVSDVPVFMRAESSRGDVWQRTVMPDRLMAWSLLPTEGATGTLKVSSVAGGVRGERAEVDLLSGVAARFDLGAEVAAAPATGRDPWRATLSAATDAAGNTVNDGTAVIFSGGNEQLDFFLTRPLIQGGQSLVLPTYPQVGDYRLQAESGLYRSAVVTLSANELQTEGLQARWLSQTPLILQLGPVLSPAGSFVDDGTPVTLSLYSSAKGSDSMLLSASNVLENGVLRWVLPPLPAGANMLEACVVGTCERLPLPANVAEPAP